MQAGSVTLYLPYLPSTWDVNRNIIEHFYGFYAKEFEAAQLGKLVFDPEIIDFMTNLVRTLV